MRQDAPEQRDLRDYLRPVLKRWWLILAVVPVVTIGTYLYYDHKPKVYQASTQLLIQPSAINELLLGGNQGQSVEATVQNLSVLLTTKPVAVKAQKILAKKGQHPEGSISANPLEQSQFLTVTASSPNPKGAALLANAYAEAFIAVQAKQLRTEAERTKLVAQQQLSAVGDDPSSESKREALEEQIQTLDLVASQARSNSGVKVIEKAAVSTVPVEHDPLSNAIFAFVVSLMLAIGAAFGLEYLTRKVSSVEDAEELFQLPILTEVPKVDSPTPQDVHGASIEKQLHEPFHRLQMNLDMLGHEAPLRTILVVSAAPNEGKSMVTRNLGLAFREAGRNVAVLDADFRKATLGGMLEAEEGPGLTDIISGRVTFGQAVQEVSVPAKQNGNGDVALTVSAPGAHSGHSSVGDLAMVPAGSHRGDLAATLASGGMGQALRAATDVYDRVLIDSSPILAAADVLPLLPEVDGILIVTRVGVSTRESAKRMLSELKRITNTRIVGVVVNGIPPRTYRTRAYGYYYG